MSGARAAAPMRAPALLRSALVALLACLAGAAVVGAAYGWHGAWTTFLLLAAVAAGMLGAAHLATARRARIGGSRASSRSAPASRSRRSWRRCGSARWRCSSPTTTRS